MDERVLFVAQLLEGEKLAALCRDFEMSPDAADSRASGDRAAFPSGGALVSTRAGPV